MRDMLPKIIIVDEPDTGLDARAAEKLMTRPTAEPKANGRIGRIANDSNENAKNVPN